MNPLNIAQSRIANKAPNQVSNAGMTGVYRLLGFALGINVNSLNLDNPIPLNLIPEAALGAAYYKVGAITVNNASVSLTTAQIAVYDAPAAGGNNLVSAAALSALTAAAKDLSMTLAAGATGNALTANTLYARNTTAQGAAATCDIYVWGWVYP
jgi:hypothetical protein